MAEGRDITTEVKRIIKEQLDVEEGDIKPEATSTEDLGGDSLGLGELVRAVEEPVESDIPDEETEKIRAGEGAVDHSERKPKKAERAAAYWGLGGRPACPGQPPRAARC